MEKALPIAEMFQSLQGEGQWVGTPMFFLRLAGCNVGKPAKALKVEGPFPVLHTGREAMACCTWDGRIFPCDTDYSLRERITVMALAQTIISSGMKHVCVTGGEPLLHSDLIEDLFCHLNRLDIMMHVETSGTIRPAPLVENLICPGYWITCAPKLGALTDMIERADELKLLVDDDFSLDEIPPAMLNHKNVFICPVNPVDIDKGNNPSNVKKCVEILHTMPHWRLSIQVHKLFGWR